MRAILLALLLAPFPVAPTVAATGLCDVPLSSCQGSQRCLPAAAACEQDSGEACRSPTASGHHLTKLAGGASMEVTCASGAQGTRINLVVLRWEQQSAGSATTTSILAPAAGFSWISTPSGCTFVLGAVRVDCANFPPPSPPVPGGQVLP